MTLKEFLDKLFAIYSTDSEKNAELKEQYVNAIVQMRQDFNYDKALNQIVTTNESRFIPNFPFIKSILQENINRRIEEKSIYINFYVMFPNSNAEYQYCFITTSNNLQSNWWKQLRGVENKGGMVTNVISDELEQSVADWGIIKLIILLFIITRSKKWVDCILTTLSHIENRKL